MAVHHTMCFVFTILVLCNAVLYPSIFSNIFRKWFGSEPTDEKKEVPDMPPQMRGAQRSPAGATRRMEMERTAQRNMKHAGDPASYFAQQKQEASKGRGVMGSVLPLYAVGIVIYFAYIMYRIFLKDKPNKPNEPDITAAWETEKDDSAILHRVQQEQLQKQLSEQLRADNYSGIKSRKTTTPKTRTTAPVTKSKAASEGSPDEMTALKKRLEDTERSMQRMMDMMNNMGIAMSQVTEQLTGTVPTGLTNSLNTPTHEEEVDTDDEESNEGGQRSSEEFPNSDLDSEEDCLPDVDLTKSYEGRGDDSNDDGDNEDVEIIGGVGLQELESVRRRVVSAISGES
ncbi:resistance to inhibitors of cholinesterase protein 3-like [Asterias rubens]|uniref:resistance to inhibitors of cholinesterase protein 3-like n=1 Tax=Asterias rubens TaxID=7604 RepID=UPI0014557419|nr:resistance to inhibitors of cholinesterase protein 3-like [Asterias rubens]